MWIVYTENPPYESPPLPWPAAYGLMEIHSESNIPVYARKAP